MQLKIPSSLGRFIVDSSCFFVSGPGVWEIERGGGKRQHLEKEMRDVLGCVSMTALRWREEILTRITYWKDMAPPPNPSVLTPKDLVMDCLVNDPRDHFSSTPLPISPDALLLCKEKSMSRIKPSLFSVRKSQGLSRCSVACPERIWRSWTRPEHDNKEHPGKDGFNLTVYRETHT